MAEHTDQPLQGGRVSVWHREEGWGVVSLDSGAGDCFVHFSNVPGPGFRELVVGEHVELAAEELVHGDQDGCPFRVIGMVVRAHDRGKRKRR